MKEKLDSILKPRDHSLCKQPNNQTTKHSTKKYLLYTYASSIALTIVSDSYMGFFLPGNIYERLSKFLDGDLDFPFVDQHEILGIFFLFGKNFGVKNDLDVLSAKDITRKTIDQLKREIFLSKNIGPSNIELIKENYQREGFFKFMLKCKIALHLKKER